ncbi:MAG: HAMP domain-containing histidine kinase [Saprospiraceae bacterium]|nr:HAMP domain-containing histidine kinase [Saprospiraceae bacterium]
MFRQRHHIAIVLLSLGMILLGVFLWLFLQKTYKDEQEVLRRETNLLFVNAVRSIESRLFDKLVVRRWDTFQGDTAVSISLRLPTPPRPHPPKDSGRVFAIVQEKAFVTRDVQEIRGEKVQDMKIMLNKDPEPDQEEISGTLSIFVGVDSCGVPLHDSGAMPVRNTLERYFNEAMLSAALPVQWRMATLNDSIPKGAFVAGQYTDVVNGERLRAVISQYNGYLLRKMAPQMAFSLLLFASVALAFLFVYQSLRKQMRLTEIKNEFIRNMTHELKTPISTVSVAIEALQNFDALQNPERTREYLAISQLELNRLSLLVDKVLRMSLFEQGEPELKTEPIDFLALVEEVLAAMKLQFEKYRAEVSLSITGQHFNLHGDRLHLVSVLYNLLENALKYSPESPKIEIRLVHSGGHLTLHVKDQGRGIPAAYLDRIFDKFFRVPTGDVHDVKGHGLGLNYVAGVVRLHQGHIEVNSQVGLGTEFTVRFPGTSQ